MIFDFIGSHFKKHLILFVYEVLCDIRIHLKVSPPREFSYLSFEIFPATDCCFAVRVGHNPFLWHILF